MTTEEEDFIKQLDLKLGRYASWQQEAAALLPFAASYFAAEADKMQAEDFHALSRTFRSYATRIDELLRRVEL